MCSVERQDRTVLHVDWEGYGREWLWSLSQHLPGLGDGVVT